MPAPPATGTFRAYPLSIFVVDGNGFAIGTLADNYLKNADNAAVVAFFNAGGYDRLYSGNPFPGANQYVWPFRINSAFPAGAVPFSDVTYELEAFSDTSAIVFNPDTVDEQVIDILSGDFPAGFGATNIKIRFKWVTELIAGQLTNTIDFINLRYFGGTVKNLSAPFQTSAAFSESDADGIVPVGTYFNAAQTFKSFGFQLRFNERSAGGGIAGNYFSLFNLEISGDYITDSSSIVAATPTSNLNAGDEVTITDPQERMQDVKDIYLETIVDGETVRTLVTITFISLDGRTIIVRLPRALAGNGTDELIATFFTGADVSLAILSPQLADGSGIYKLTANKTDDTYYDRSVSPVVTVDMKIPTPFIRTGFF